MCAVNFSDISRWWRLNPKTKNQEEIEIMDADKILALLAECKWTNEKSGIHVLETLVERSEMFPYKKKHFYLFLKTGFAKSCMDKATEMGNLKPVT